MGNVNKMPLFGARTPAELRDKGIVAVLGMHRSGTSAIAGMLADHGVELGPVSEQNRFNPRGNREIRELNRLHDRILERSGGSWWDPPARIRARSGDYRRRNEILHSIPGETIGVKDPRLLLVLDLWRDLNPRPIGVIRNPVAVRESLERRAHERRRRHPQLSAAGWDELWLIYNRALLAEHRRDPFPVIDFDTSTPRFGRHSPSMTWSPRRSPASSSASWSASPPATGGRRWARARRWSSGTPWRRSRLLRSPLRPSRRPDRNTGLVGRPETMHLKQRAQAPPYCVLGRGHGLSHCPLPASLPGGAWTSPFQAQRSRTTH